MLSQFLAESKVQCSVVDSLLELSGTLSELLLILVVDILDHIEPVLELRLELLLIHVKLLHQVVLGRVEGLLFLFGLLNANLVRD